jgi:hypothetical protein
MVEAVLVGLAPLDYYGNQINVSILLFYFRRCATLLNYQD